MRFVSKHVAHAFHPSGPTSATALAARTGISKGAVSKLLARIEAKALLERETVDEDRRNHVVALSDAGQALVPELAQLADQNDDEFSAICPRRSERRSSM